MDRSFIGENERERKRLQMLAAQISDEELNLVLWEGWSIAVALAHLAFWDQRALALMHKWKKSKVAPSPIDDDVTNDALLPFFQAIPPRMAANLAVSSAMAIDLELESSPDNIVGDIVKLGDRFRLYRADHRKTHLDQIENILYAQKGKI